MKKHELINGYTPEQIWHWLDWLKFSCGDLLCDECGFQEICGHLDEDEMAGSALALIDRLETERDAALAKVPKWISVEEQPNPPEDGEYWCHGYWLMSGRKQTEVAEYLGEWKIANNFILTHWMPLPEPPKEEDHGQTDAEP